MSRVFLSLGSNLGDRLGYLQSATEALGRGPEIEISGSSKVYETEPVGVEGEQPEYLNCVIEALCGLPPAELLRYCQGVESALGREKKGEKAPRTVDIDILVFGDEVVESPELTVPHPGVLRAFNLVGLADLAPDLYIPGFGVVGGLLREASPAELKGVRALEVRRLC